MNAKETRKKARERFYVEEFLKANDWPYEIDDAHKEKPDFLLRTAKHSLGLEVTELTKDEVVGGSLYRKRESIRDAYLQKLKLAYYADGGKVAKVKALLPEYELTESWIPKLVKRLRMARPSVAWKQRMRRIDLGNGMIATFYVCALPEEAREYDRWECVSNSIGWVRSATDQILSEKIKMKAKNLPKYRETTEQVMLLIVADRRRASGMFAYSPTDKVLPTEGFSEVHLLVYPLKSYRIA